MLGQERVHPTSNEITAVPALLEKLHLAGCIVSLDALHCQVKMVETIVAQDADYVITVKANQGSLYDGIHQAFVQDHATAFADVAHDELYLEFPYYGARRMAAQLGREGQPLARKTVRKYMQEMGLIAVYPGPNLSKRHRAHRVFPYLPRDTTPGVPDHV